MPRPSGDVITGAVQAALADARLWLIGPEILIAAAACIALVLAVLLPRRRQRAVGWAALVGVLVALAYLVLVLGPGRGPGVVSAFAGLFTHDPFAAFFKYLFLISTGLTILLSLRYLDEEGAQAGEYYGLLLFATLGMMFMASGQDLVTIYVGLELMAISVYVLVGFLRADRRSNEAAMKYFLLGAFSSAFFLYGISLFYGLSGSTSLAEVRSVLAAAPANPMAVLALILMSVGLGFKVAAVPFHAWAPDAYEGAPTPITAYLSVASKAAAFAVLMRVLLVGLYDLRGEWSLLLWVLAAASMTLGNLVAIVQDNVKRMLAYSSIAHAGYLLMGVLAAGASAPAELAAAGGFAAQRSWSGDLQRLAQGGVLIYLLAYTFMNLGAFAVVTLLRRRQVVGDQVSDFAGLYRRAPYWAVAMSVFLLSLAGIPPTAGFIGKLVLFAAAIKTHYYVLALIAVLNTAVSVYFYFRIVVMMWMKEPGEATAYAGSPELGSAVAVAVLFTLVIGVWPGPFLDLAQRSILAVPTSFFALR